MMMKSFWNYGEVMSCSTEQQLRDIFVTINWGFSGVPSTSTQFNHILNQKEAMDWILQRCRDLNLVKLKEEVEIKRQYLVSQLKVLLA